MGGFKYIGLFLGLSLAFSYGLMIYNSGDNYRVILRGSGASFPYPLIQVLIDKYTIINPDITIDYASIGSGAGQSNLLNLLVDFAGSDAPLTDEQLASSNTWILHIPYALGGVVLSYNIPGLEGGLNLTAELIAGIFMGEIRFWNDGRLLKYNPGLKDIGEEIYVIHRSDSSGTTYIFTRFLAKFVPEWRDRIGFGKSVSWPTLPTFMGGKGNEGVTNLIMQTPFSIGYIEYTYAYKSGLKMAAVMDSHGDFIYPTIDSISRAGDIDTTVLDPMDLRISDYIIGSRVRGAYPVSAPTYFLVYMDWAVYGLDESIRVKASAFIEWVEWILAYGDKYYIELGYAPLPSRLKELVLEALSLIMFNGEPVV